MSKFVTVGGGKKKKKGNGGSNNANAPGRCWFCKLRETNSHDTLSVKPMAFTMCSMTAQVCGGGSSARAAMKERLASGSLCSHHTKFAKEM